MATNQYFRNYNYVDEQTLIDDLVVESIAMYGIDLVYLTRGLVAVDEILNEDDLSIFSNSFDLEMYVKSVDGFEGEGDFLSRFGLQIRDQATFSVARKTFERYVSDNVPEISRPKEGDMIYFPLNKKFFKITYVEHESVFYQTGALQVYDLKTELFEYSNERFQTGRPEIDTYFDDYRTDGSTTLSDLGSRDPNSKNEFFESEGDDIVDFSEIDPFSETITYPEDE